LPLDLVTMKVPAGFAKSPLPVLQNYQAVM
jgi:hypothetical protein